MELFEFLKRDQPNYIFNSKANAIFYTIKNLNGNEKILNCFTNRLLTFIEYCSFKINSFSTEMKLYQYLKTNCYMIFAYFRNSNNILNNKV